jgi:hypothetical protein
MLTVIHMRFKFVIATIVSAVGFAVPGYSEPAPTPTLEALATLQPGQWELKPRAGAGATKSLCLNDMRALLQIKHSASACSRFIIANDSRQTTVQYRCAKSGNGRTTVRVETPRLVQIQSQGIADNEPFAIELEGRRVGACAAPGSLPQGGRR